MDTVKVINAGEAGRVSGLLVGLFQGAGLGSVFIPIPLVGSFFGAVVGGVVGSKAGRYLGGTLDKGAAIAAQGVSAVTSGSSAKARPKRPAGAVKAESTPIAPKPLALVAVPAAPELEASAESDAAPPVKRRSGTRTARSGTRSAGRSTVRVTEVAATTEGSPDAATPAPRPRRTAPRRKPAATAAETPVIETPPVAEAPTEPEA